MAGKHKYIEEIFRNAFDKHTVKPPNSAWSGMKSSLDNMRLEHLAKTKLSNVSTQPSASLWTKISTRLWWKQFLRFNPLRVNIYYAGLALIGGSTAILSSLNPSSDPEFNHIKADDVSDFIVQQSLVVENMNKLQHKRIEKNRNTADFMASRSESVVSEPAEQQEKPEKIMAEQKSTEKMESSAEEAVDKAKSSDFHDEAPVAGTENTIQTKKHELAENLPIPIAKLAAVEGVKPVTDLGDVASRPDTLGLDFKGDPIVKDLNFIEQGWYAGANFFKQDIAFLNEEIKEAYDQNKHYSDFSYRFGLRVNIVRNHFMLQSGIYFSSVNNVFEHAQEQTLIEDDIEGRVIWPYESDTISHTSIHEYHNTYSYFEVPVLAGLHLEGTNFATNLKTGPVFNYVAGVNANLVLYTDNELRSIDKSYFRRPGLRWEVSADLIYKFNDKLSIYIEPAYVHDVTTIFDKEMDIRSRFKGFSAGMGVYYRF
ncbi:MAG: hypothetical protein ACQES1_07535 [Bacteroidota bacterium]